MFGSKESAELAAVQQRQLAMANAFSDGIDLHGHEGPSRILCATPAQRDEIRALLTTKNITHIAGRPIEEVVTL